MHGCRYLSCWGYERGYKGFSMIWLALPAFAAAGAGINYAWLVGFPIVFAFSCALLFASQIRSRPAWKRLLLINGAGALVYCVIAYEYATKCPVPIPEKTKYDSEPEKRDAFLRCYQE